MRWKHAAGSLLMVCALLFAGHGGARVGETAAGKDGRGPVTLVMGRDLSGYVRGLLDAWNARHPREKATLVELPDATDEVRAQMATELRSGSDRFDVLGIDVAWTSEFAAAGWITPMDGGQFRLDRFLPPVVDTATFRGRLYAVPYTTDAGLLYYRKDLLDREGVRPPRTWAELKRLAKTVAPKYGLDGYAGQFLPYEGLTANTVEAVQSAGGSVLAGEGTRVTVDSPEARRGLSFLLDGVREGWIPKRALAFKEEQSRRAFEDGRLLFLRNWPYAYALANAGSSKVAGKIGAVPLPGPDGPGSGVLGGSNLAVNTHSRHQKTAAELISYLTSRPVQRQALTAGVSPVWADLYADPARVRRFPHLPALKQSVLTARPRPKSPRYDQVSLAIQAVMHDALTHGRSTDATAARLTRELRAIVGRD